MKYFIYAIQHGFNDDPVKIGMTRDTPEKRLVALQVGNPIQLQLLGYLETEFPQLEKEIHDCLSRWRVLGEWFMQSRQVESVVDAIVHNDEDELIALLGLAKVISSIALQRTRKDYEYKLASVALTGYMTHD